MASSSDVNKAMARGVAWMSAARLAVRGLGLISTFVLARLLGPQDFGLIAMASAVIALAELIRAFSFESALIQEQQARPEDYSTAWTLNVLLGAGTGAVLMACAPFIATLYQDQRITGILIVLATGFIADGFVNTGTVEFRKNLDFRRDFILMVVQKIVAFAVTLSLAAWLRSYWAMAFGTLTSSLVAVVMSYVMHPFRPRFTLVARDKLVGFSKWMLFSNFTLFLRNKTADILLGRIGGPQAAGVFSVAYDVANLATTELVAPINRAVLPGYVRLASDATALREGFSRVLGFIALFACPAALGVAALSEPLVALVLGPKWHQAAPLVQILSIAAALNALLTNSVSVYLAVGRPKLVALMSMVHTAGLLPLLITGILLDRGTGAAWAHLVQVVLVTLPSTYYLLIRFTPITVGDIFGAIWRPIASAGTMCVAISWLYATLPPAVGIRLIANLITCVLAGVAVYAIAVLAAWRAAGAPDGAERILLNFVNARMRRRVATLP